MTSRSRLLASSLLAITITLAFGETLPTAAEAEDLAPPLPPTLLGDWAGIRPALATRGITVAAGFIGEGADDVHGGRERGGAFAYELNFAANADLGTLVGWHGAKLHVSFVHRDGDNLSTTRIGNIIQVQEIYSKPDRFRLFILSAEQSLLNDHVDIVVGRLVESGDFANSDYFCGSQSLAICGVPYALPFNGGFSHYPISSWGARIKLKSTNGWQIQGGVYEVNPKLAGRNGFDLSTGGATGVSLPLELAYKSERTTFKIGFVYDTSSRPDYYSSEAGYSYVSTMVIPRKDVGQASGYAMIEQTVIGSGKPGTRNVVLLGGIVFSDKRTSFFQDFEYGSIILNRPFSGRPADSISLLFARGGVSTQLARSQRLLKPSNGIQSQDAESILEADYHYAVAPGLMASPNVQVVFHPGASSAIQNATVLGLKITAAL